MVHLSEGVLPGSRIYFHTPSQTARNTFFYPLCIGHFYCDGTYQVNRTSYDSFLIMYIRNGSGSVSIQNKTYPVTAGDIVFLDCYRPHYYETKTGWEILWIHIDGPLCNNYYHLFAASGAPVMTIQEKKVLQDFETPFQFLFHTFTHNIPCAEVLLSKYITDMLTILLNHSFQPYHCSSQTPAIDTILAYIREHFQEPLCIDDLAGQASLSRYYFIRLFKKEMSMTPHQYITALRLNSAKFYLRTTSSSIKEIGYRCGFQSENSFCISFKKLTGMTPSEYRNLDSI